MRFRIILVLALAAPLATLACGSSNSSPSMPTSPSGSATPVSIPRGADVLTSTAYNPNPVSVTVGTTVTWTNNDTTAHTATGDDGTWNSGTMLPGATFSRTFNTAGTFTYHCTIHPNMVASVMVR
jgi:plastocyanin